MGVKNKDCFIPFIHQKPVFIRLINQMVIWKETVLFAVIDYILVDQFEQSQTFVAKSS